MHAELKRKAILLRKAGRTYFEILEEVPVAKSTLSLWLRDVGLAKQQAQRISSVKREAALRGAQARRNKRLAEIETHIHNGRKEVGTITNRELLLIATALYWAEGSKQNTRSPSAGIQFGNTDSQMLRVFLAWLRLQKITEENIGYELYVHRDRKADTEAFRSWWARELGISKKLINRVYFKKGARITRRSNTGHLYHGLLRIRVKSSTSLNRQIHGWIKGIVASI